MTTNKKWQTATLKQKNERNKAIFTALDMSVSLSQIARENGLSVARIAGLRDQRKRELLRLKTGSWTGKFNDGRVRRALQNIGVDSLDALIAFALVDGKWSNYNFLKKDYGHYCSRQGLPNFGKNSYSNMVKDLKNNSNARDIKKLRDAGFYDFPLKRLSPQEKERALYERLKVKYEPKL